METIVLSSKQCAEKHNQFISNSEHKCTQCNKDMGYEYILGPVCGQCCRKNHRKALRLK